MGKLAAVEQDKDRRARERTAGLHRLVEEARGTSGEDLVDDLALRCGRAASIVATPVAKLYDPLLWL
jgi:hypothetical protein